MAEGPRKAARPVPRPFSFPWGSGQIVEEAAFRGRHHEPVIQLLAFADGSCIVRFCSYTLAGRFERNSWLAGPEELEGLSREVSRLPRLSSYLRTLAGV